jgi:hypothetical protein
MDPGADEASLAMRTGALAHAPRSARLAAIGVACCAAFGLPGVLAAPAGAHESTTHYSLEIVEGVSTLPEESPVRTTGYGEHQKSTRVRIFHNGALVNQETGGEWTSLWHVGPQVGDVVTLESPIGTVIASEIYDGLPTMDVTVCAGSANFSGQRSSGQTVQGHFFTLNPYGHRLGEGQAQITSLSGSAFGGSFLAPLALGETVVAAESLETPLPGNAVFTYEAETWRPVGACPVPPPPPYVPPPPPALAGAVVRLVATTLHTLLGHGWSNHVGINQPGTVTQDLYMQGGTLPAFASSTHHHSHPAILLARGSARAATAGTVTVTLHVVNSARGRLRSAHTIHGVLITTLRSASGARLTLPRRFVTLHH